MSCACVVCCGVRWSGVLCSSVCEMKMVSVAEGLTGRWYQGVVSSLAKYILMIMMNKNKKK